jgi:putative transposase
MLLRLEEICNNICALWDVEVLEFGGEVDHVHMLLSMHPNLTPSKFINNLKTVSSRLIRKEYKSYLERFYWKPILWTRAYCLITAGGAPIEILKNYIEKQNRPEK